MLFDRDIGFETIKSKYYLPDSKAMNIIHALIHYKRSFSRVFMDNVIIHIKMWKKSFIH